jgi:hypothetical protein
MEHGHDALAVAVAVMSPNFWHELPVVRCPRADQWSAITERGASSCVAASELGAAAGAWKLANQPRRRAIAGRRGGRRTGARR